MNRVRRDLALAQRSLAHAKRATWRAYAKIRDARDAITGKINCVASEPMRLAVEKELSDITELALESYSKAPGYRMNQLADLLGVEAKS